jgi:spore germination protein YaaH
VTFDIESMDMVREYIGYLANKNSATNAGLGSDEAVIDWDVIQSAIEGSESIEEAVGRAVVVADLMSRGAYKGQFGEAGANTHLSSNRFFAFDNSNATADFGERSRFRTWIAERASAHRALTSTGISIVMILAALAISSATDHKASIWPAFKTTAATVVSGNAQVQLASASDTDAAGAGATLGANGITTALSAATAPPAPPPPTLASAPPLRPHEIFGFAPYWTLDQSSGFDVSRISTFAYFSIPVNADGSLMESGPGWSGFQSQDLTNLITRAHAAGDRVVLTVNCFGQDTLNQLTTSPNAPSTLTTALLAAIREKNLDGVNLDFEGTGSGDQAGLTNLVTQVSTGIHQANPHYQVTMDTYASSGGDPNGFYNIKALAPAVNAFFVMQYQLNLQSDGSATSPLTSAMFSDKDTIDQYLAAVPASKIILGLPYFGIDWPTTNGTLTAQSTGSATPVSYGQVMASGHPIYWDSTTDTAWTSYRVGSQWHETFFEDPTSLYEAAQMANGANLAGVGIWALGMDGNSPALLSALLGGAAPVKQGAAGPSVTSESPSSSTTTTSSTSPAATSTTSSTVANSPTSEIGATSTTSTSTSSTSTTTIPAATSTTTTLSATSEIQSSNYGYSGKWAGKPVTLTEVPPDSVQGQGTQVASLTNFSTSDPQLSCLAANADISVFSWPGSPDEYVVEATEPGNCANAYFVFFASS